MEIRERDATVRGDTGKRMGKKVEFEDLGGRMGRTRC